MTGPYEYVAPSYWQEQTRPTRPGNSATRAAAAEPTASTPKPAWDRRCLPSKVFEPWWEKITSGRSTTPGCYHAGGGVFKDIHVFTDALNARFGPATSADDYAVKAQLQTYEGIRAMYEAYSRNKYTSTGVGAKAEVQALIAELAEKGLGVVLVSSELEEVVEGADTVLVLRDGAALGSLSETRSPRTRS